MHKNWEFSNMTAIITIKCLNGQNQIRVKTLQELGRLTQKFDISGTDYSIEFCQGKGKAVSQPKSFI